MIYSKKVIKTLMAIAISVFLYGCDQENNIVREKLAIEAKARVLNYIVKKGLLENKLKSFNSSANPSPDYSFIYIDDKICIEFIVYCENGTCLDIKKYPYHEHGEKCPS